MAFNPISSLFGQSPITPIQKHMQKVHDCVEQLQTFVAHAQANDWDAAQATFDKIAELGSEAAQLKTELRLHLPKSLFMPISRTDVLTVLHFQDEIANIAKDIAGIMLGRKMAPPAKLEKHFAGLVQGAISTNEKALAAINELDELIETGFGGQEVKVIQKLIKKLDKEESRLDKLEQRTRAALFTFESELNPIDAMFLYNVIDEIGKIGNTAQGVGTQLQLMVAR